MQVASPISNRLQQHQINHPDYRDVIRLIVPLHREGRQRAEAENLPLSQPFNRALYQWEHELFIDHFLSGHLGLSSEAIKPIRKMLASVAEKLLALPSVLLHRDLQSSNIHYAATEPALIDFQGMRLGPAVYDLASLFCDPYVSLDCDLQLDLLADYACQMSLDLPELKEKFWLAGIQRLAQALGAFCRLAAKRETRRFANHIPAGISMLNRCLMHTPALSNINSLKSVLQMQSP